MTHTLVHESKSVFISKGPIALSFRPQEAALIGQTVAAWSYVYNDLGVAFAEIMGDAAELGIALYRSIKSERSQQELIEMTAKAKLTGQEQRIFLAILTLARDARNRRNAFAHGLWAYSVQLPGKLLCVEVDDSLAKEGAYWKWLREMAAGDAPRRPLPTVARGRIKVYRLKDLQDAYNKVIRVAWLLSRFRLMLASVSKRQHDARRRRLASERDVQAMVRQLRSHSRRRKARAPSRKS